MSLTMKNHSNTLSWGYRSKIHFKVTVACPVILDQGTSSNGMEEEQTWVLQKAQRMPGFRLAESE